MTLETDLEDKKFANRGVSLYMSEWPEKGNMRRRWAFQRMGHPEDAVKIDDTGAGRVVTTAGKAPDKETKKRETGKRPSQKKKGKKAADTVMVEPEDLSSPLSRPVDQDKSGSGKTLSAKRKCSPLATRIKQAKIEEMEMREYREESKKERAKRAAKEQRSSTSKQSPSTQMRAKSEKWSKTLARKMSSVTASQSETSTRAPKKAVVPKSDTTSARGSSYQIEKKMDRLTQMVECLIVKVDNLQKTLSDEQRIRASKDPRLAELLTRAEKNTGHLQSHYSSLVFLDKFPEGKKDDLKKMADDIRRLNDLR